MPSLSLSGSIGLQSSESADWFDPDQWFRNLSANLLAPVLQRGRLRGNLALAEARLDEAVAAFGRSVLTAVHEVESAIAGLEAARRRLGLLGSLEEAAKAEAALRDDRYAFGLDDYASFLAAAQILVSAKSARAAGERMRDWLCTAPSGVHGHPGSPGIPHRAVLDLLGLIDHIPAVIEEGNSRNRKVERRRPVLFDILCYRIAP